MQSDWTCFWLGLVSQIGTSPGGASREENRGVVTSLNRDQRIT